MADRRSVLPQSFLHSAGERPKYTHKPERNNAREREDQYERKEGVCGLLAKSLTPASRAGRPMYSHKPERKKREENAKASKRGKRESVAQCLFIAPLCNSSGQKFDSC